MKKTGLIERTRRIWKDDLPACVDCKYCDKAGSLLCRVPNYYEKDLVTGSVTPKYLGCKDSRYSADAHCKEAGIYFTPKEKE